MKIRFLVIALCTLGVIAPAYADAVFTLGNHPSKTLGEQNVLFHSDQTGMTIEGFTNVSHTEVQFSSTTDTLVGTGGQSDVDAVSGGALHDITFMIPGHTFEDAIINPETPGASDDLKVTVVTNTGDFAFTPYGRTHGENFLTITTSGGELIDSVTIDSASGFQDLKQPRISGVSGALVVPEPSSALLMGSGLSLLFLLLIQKKGRRLGFKA